eukprot:3333239-Lingulodinium_polyedra.AAC.1
MACRQALGRVLRTLEAQAAQGQVFTPDWPDRVYLQVNGGPLQLAAQVNRQTLRVHWEPALRTLWPH